LDGKIALASGESRWITASETRAFAHSIRADSAAIVVGSGTALADDPELSLRHGVIAAQGPPLRVLLDRRLRTPLGAKLFDPTLGSTLVITSAGADPVKQSQLRARGLAIRHADAEDAAAQCATLAAYLDEVAAPDLPILVEGGGIVAAALLRADLVDEIWWMRAPVIFGADARPAIADLGIDSLAAAPRFARVSATPSGPDLIERYRRTR